MTAQTAATPDAESGSTLISPQRRNFVFLAIMLGMLMAALDQTIVATALPTIVADLGDAGHQSWVVTSYLLASTIITALAGRLGDLFGRKRVFQAAVTLFIVGSALCGISQSMAMLVGARALQGLGGGAITVTATALIGEIIPLRDRGRYQGALGAVFGVTTVIGPLLGGYFTDHLSWRWAFYINVPVSIVVFFVAAAAIPSLAGRAKPVIDYTGILLVGLGATGLTLATSWGGTTYPWKSATIIGLFAGSTLALGIFVWVESRVAAPILPTRLFGSPVFTVCCVLSFVVGFAMLGALTFLPTYMQFVDGVSATTSGLRTLPMVVGMLSTSMGSGVIVGRTGRYKVFPIAGSAVMAVAFLLMSRMNPSTSALLQSLYLFILGAGIGLCMQVLILIVQNTSYEVLEPTFDRLVRGGYAQRDVDRLSLTPSGARQVDFITTLIREWIVDKLTRSPNFQGRPDRAQVQTALDRIAHRIVAQPDWDDDRRRLSAADREATERLPVAASGVPSRHEPNRNIP